MGIQFTLAIEGNEPQQVRCYCTGVGPVVESYADFRMFLEQYMASPYQLPGCEDDYCLADAPQAITLIHGEEPLSVGVAIGNQRVVLEALGYDGEDDFGSATADDLEGRILLALAVAPESAEKLAEVTNKGGEGKGPRWIDCGRDAGYVQDKLVAIQQVVAQARRLGRTITWG